MPDTVFKSPVTQSVVEHTAQSLPTEDSKANTSSVIEPPYLDYQSEHAHPYTVDHFKLGDKYDVFSGEISTIENYIKNQIDHGEVSNSIPAIKQMLEKMEKLTNVSRETRTVVKIGTLAAHIEFLNRVHGITNNLRRYNG